MWRDTPKTLPPGAVRQRSAAAVFIQGGTATRLRHGARSRLNCIADKAVASGAVLNVVGDIQPATRSWP